ncbi:ribosomal protein L10-domain-containing protein [Syncephalastrum racemosum]|uniref:Ribosome assembly factor mrt4 n=1 Tax=Syncephalastrum racemosum TaxID=13706 RepID=A0A1X2HMS3_SYNRA|nr:ribosomal protein L10-domain-containing protein [Syncephalastrum racemosum]
MPKSKRSTVVALTKTDRKGQDGKDKLIEDIRESADKYDYIWLFSVKDMRNTFLKDVRNDFKSTSRIFLGKNRVMAKALGTTEEEEYKPGVSKIANKLHKEVGLLFTNKPYDEVVDFFAKYSQPDYARSGTVATQTVSLPEGPVKRGVDPAPHNMEPLLRSLGMPTSLVNGIVTLPIPYTICKEGDTLTTNQAHLLKLFYYQLAEFRVDLLSCYHDGDVKILKEE